MIRTTPAWNGDRTSLVFDPRQLRIAMPGQGHAMNIQVQEEGTTVTFSADDKPLVVKNSRLYRRLS